MMHILTFVVGLFFGYWAYPIRMFWKLYKIQKKIAKLEIDFMQTREELHGKQWNEDNL